MPFRFFYSFENSKMNRFGFFTTWLLLWLSISPRHYLAGQTATVYLDEAYDHLEQGDWAPSLAAAQTAATMFKDSINYPGWLQAQLILSNAIFEQTRDPFKALEVTKSTLNDPWLKLQKEDDFYRYCKVLLFNTWLSKQVGDFAHVKENMEEAYALFKKNLPTKGYKIADFIFADLGNAYVRLKEYQGARQIFEENIQYSQSYPVCAKYNDYGSLYFSLGPTALPTALGIFQQGLEFNKKQPAGSKLPDAEVKLLYLNKAECLAQMGRFDEALDVNREASDLQLSVDDERYQRCMYGLFENYGIIYAGMGKSGRRGKFAESAQWYKKAITLTSNPKNRAPGREIAGFQIALGEVLLDWGKPREALTAFHEAIRTLMPGVSNNSGLNPSVQLLFPEAMLIRALHGKARAFNTLNQLDKALDCYELIPIVEAKLRATHSYESSSLLALKESRQRFQEAVDIAWKLFESSNGNPQYTARAFRLTELARGMLLLQSLIQARQYLPDTIRSKDYELRVRMAWLEHEIAAEQEKIQAASHNQKADSKARQIKISDLERQLFELKLERQKLLADFPAYNNPDSLFLQVLAAKDVRNLLRPGQAMVAYFLTEMAAYIFSFDARGEIRWRSAALPQLFREQTKDFVGYLWAGKEAGRDKFLHQAWLLDSLLLGPERAHWGTSANSLMVVPDDILMLVPFEVLLSRPVLSNHPWRDQPWLLYGYNIGYAYSATLLKVQKGISEEHAIAAVKPAYTLGGFAPTYSNSSYYKLENTAPMVKNVRSLLGGDAWLGIESSEERFKNTAAHYRILLLAMHGISDNENPELSRLLFGDAGPDSLINNNILYASELQIMRLQADLVVLSACHTGSGKLEQGEGVYSLARAFAAARVPATVMSLWLLHASMAPPLVEAFFKYLHQGKTKDEALKLAKREFLKNDENFEMTHPFYWAGLAASGDMRALELPAKPAFEWQLWGALAAISAFLGYYLWRRKGNRTK